MKPSERIQQIAEKKIAEQLQGKAIGNIEVLVDQVGRGEMFFAILQYLDEEHVRRLEWEAQLIKNSAITISGVTVIASSQEEVLASLRSALESKKVPPDEPA